MPHRQVKQSTRNVYKALKTRKESQWIPKFSARIEEAILMSSLIMAAD
jgi:hypothetical protein